MSMESGGVNGEIRTRVQRAADGSLGFAALTPVKGPGLAMAAMILAGFVLETARGGPALWGVSAQALADGRFGTLLGHMFAHGGSTHLILNLGALLALSPPVARRLGVGVDGWLRYARLYLGAGLAGAALFLAVHFDGATPMLGASGAICGLWGAGARIPAAGGALAPLSAPAVRRTVVDFAASNLVMVAVLFGFSLLAGRPGVSLAWEAHLGGFLFGLFAIGPLSPRAAAAPALA